MMDVLTVVGARPQFIKASALSRAFLSGGTGISERILHTGQHPDDAMSGVFFAELGMPAPHHHLTLTASDVAERLGQIMQGISSVVAASRPDVMLVYGDTDSTWAGAWVAARHGIPLVHVEAGLRSGDRTMPEEINRILTDHVSDVLFCPTEQAVANLAREGIVHQAGDAHGRRVEVRVTGDILCDVARWAAEAHRSLRGPGPGSGKFTGVSGLVTLHRPANVDAPRRLLRWMEALGQVARSAPGGLVFPVHPRTAAALERAWGPDWRENLEQRGLQVVPPLSYMELAALLAEVEWVLTDSGGLQKEAFFHGKPCWVARPVTEWGELVEGGWACLAPEPEAWVSAMLSDGGHFPPPGDAQWRVPLYGDGYAAEAMVAALVQWWETHSNRR
jgi:UDP-GlcNAc3NAcA epimerase